MLIRSMLYHRKPLFYLFIALLAAAIAAGVWLLVRSPVQSTGNQATPAPVASPANEAENQFKTITLELYQDKAYAQSVTVKDPDKVQIVRDAVFSLLVQSSLCEGIDIGSLDDCILIQDAYQTDFYVYGIDGKHYIQNGRDGFCQIISHAVYTRLYDLAAGYLPADMTVTRGIESITVPGLITYRQEPGKPEIENEGYVITPGYDDLPSVLYTGDMALTIGDTPVHIFRGEPEVGAIVGLCSVYDAEGNWIPYPEAVCSSITPYFAAPEIPGRYIVTVLFQEGDGDSMLHTEYAYAIDIVPPPIQGDE